MVRKPFFKGLLLAMAVIAIVSFFASPADAKVRQHVIGNVTYFTAGEDGQVISAVSWVEKGQTVTLIWANAEKTSVKVKKVRLPKANAPAPKKVQKRTTQQKQQPTTSKLVPTDSGKEAKKSAKAEGQAAPKTETPQAQAIPQPTGEQPQAAVPQAPSGNQANEGQQPVATGGQTPPAAALTSQPEVSPAGPTNVTPVPAEQSPAQPAVTPVPAVPTPAPAEASKAIQPQSKVPDAVNRPRAAKAPGAANVGFSGEGQQHRVPANSADRQPVECFERSYPDADGQGEWTESRKKYVWREKTADGLPIIRQRVVNRKAWTNLPPKGDIQEGFAWIPGQIIPPSWMQQVGNRMVGIDPATGFTAEMPIPMGAKTYCDNRGNADGMIGKFTSVPEGAQILTRIDQAKKRGGHDTPFG